MSQAIPLLVVDSIQVDPAEPDRVLAKITVGGHPVQVVVDFSRKDRIGIEYVEMPTLLDIHQPSQRAVTDLMARVHAGEAIVTPIDLTDQIRKSSSRSPYEPKSEERRAALESMADKVELRIVDLELARGEPNHFKASLEIDGRAIALTGEIYAGPDRVPVLLWRKGPDPHSLTDSQHYAIQRALLHRLNADEPQGEAGSTDLKS